MKKFYINIFVFFTLISCGNNNKTVSLNESNNNKTEKELMRLRYNYVVSGNKSSLDSAYTLINSSKYFDNHELNDENLGLFFPIYYYLGKYSEMSYLLRRTKEIDKSTQEYFLNITNAFSNYEKGNLGSAKNDIKRNIDLIERKLQINPLDSLYLIDLFKMKLHIKNYDLVIKEVDSLRTNSKKFSEAFYNDILIPELNDYKRELPDYVSEIPIKSSGPI